MRNIPGAMSILVALLLFVGCASSYKIDATNTDMVVFGKLINEKTGNGMSKTIHKYYRENIVIAYRKYSEEGYLIESWGEIPDGLVLTLHDSGQIGSLITYKDQLPNGIALAFFNNGSLETLVNYKTGMPEGRAVIYYPDGSIHVDQMHIDSKEVYYRQYNENGEINFERGHYVPE